MKLVIEINESKYERLKFLVEQGFGTDIDEIIVNATPLTDCTDAISRSAVIEAFVDMRDGYPNPSGEMISDKTI